MVAAVSSTPTLKAHQPSLSPDGVGEEARGTAQQPSACGGNKLPAAVTSAPQAAARPAVRTAHNALPPSTEVEASQPAEAAPTRRSSEPQAAGPSTDQLSMREEVFARASVTDRPAPSGSARISNGQPSAAVAAADAAEPDDGMTEEWFGSVTETSTPYSLTLKQHRQLQKLFIEHVARMVFNRRTQDSDARLRMVIASARCHDMVQPVLARLKLPLLVQLLYEHPNQHVASQARLLNRSEDWRAALRLMREQAMQQLGITKAQADRMVARVAETHTAPADIMSADIMSADVAGELAEGGNAGRRGKRGRRPNKHAPPPPAVDRAAAATGHGGGPRPKTVLVPGRKRLRTLARPDDSARQPAMQDEQAEDLAVQTTAAEQEPEKIIRHNSNLPSGDADAAAVEMREPLPVKRGPGRPRKADTLRKQKTAAGVPSAARGRLRKRALQAEDEGPELLLMACQLPAPPLPQQPRKLTRVPAAANASKPMPKTARRQPLTQALALAPKHMRGTARQTAAAMAAALTAPAMSPTAPPQPQPPQRSAAEAIEQPPSGLLGLLGSSVPARPPAGPGLAKPGPAPPAVPAAAASAELRHDRRSTRGMNVPAVVHPPLGLPAVEEQRSGPDGPAARNPEILLDAAPPPAAAEDAPAQLLPPVSPPSCAACDPPTASGSPFAAQQHDDTPQPHNPCALASPAQSRAVSPAQGIPISDDQDSPFRISPAAATQPPAPGKPLGQANTSAAATPSELAAFMAVMMPVAVAGHERQDESMGFADQQGATDVAQQQGGMKQQGLSRQARMGTSLTLQNMQHSWWQADGSVKMQAGRTAAAKAQDMQSDSEEAALAGAAAADAAAPAAAAEPAAAVLSGTDCEIVPGACASEASPDARKMTFALASAAPPEVDCEIVPVPEEDCAAWPTQQEPTSPQAWPDPRERAASESHLQEIKADSSAAPVQVLLHRSRSLPNKATFVPPVRAGWLIAITENGHGPSVHATAGGDQEPPVTSAAPEQPPVAAGAAERQGNAPAQLPTAPDQGPFVEASPEADASSGPASKPVALTAAAALEPATAALELGSKGSNSGVEAGQNVEPLWTAAKAPAVAPMANGWHPQTATQKPVKAPSQRPLPAQFAVDGRPLPPPITLKPPGPATAFYSGSPAGRGSHSGRLPAGRSPAGRFSGGQFSARPLMHRGRGGGRWAPPARGHVLRPQQWPVNPPAPASHFYGHWAVAPAQEMAAWVAPAWHPPAPPLPQYPVAQGHVPVAQPTGGAGTGTC